MAPAKQPAAAAPCLINQMILDCISKYAELHATIYGGSSIWQNDVIFSGVVKTIYEMV